MPIGKGRLARRCKDCGTRYIPSGKFQKYCVDCWMKRIKFGYSKQLFIRLRNLTTPKE